MNIERRTLSNYNRMTKDRAMSDDKKAQLDSETILMTLDQIRQTIDIMTSVVSRLRGYITEQSATAAQTTQETELLPTLAEHSQTIH
jgi:argininosuccinate lyase